MQRAHTGSATVSKASPKRPGNPSSWSRTYRLQNGLAETTSVRGAPLRPPSTASSSTRRHGSSSSCPVSGPKGLAVDAGPGGASRAAGPRRTARGAELADRAAAARPGSGADCAGGGARLLTRRSLARPAGHPRAAPRPAAAAAGRDGECHDRPGQEVVAADRAGECPARPARKPAQSRDDRELRRGASPEPDLGSECQSRHLRELPHPCHAAGQCRRDPGTGRSNLSRKRPCPRRPPRRAKAGCWG